MSLHLSKCEIVGYLMPRLILKMKTLFFNFHDVKKTRWSSLKFYMKHLRFMEF